MPIFDATAPDASNPQIKDTPPSGQTWTGTSDMATPQVRLSLATPRFTSQQGQGSYDN